MLTVDREADDLVYSVLLQLVRTLVVLRHVLAAAHAGVGTYVCGGGRGAHETRRGWGR